MKSLIPLRFKVIVGVVSLAALLSGTVFYLTAIRFHRLAEESFALQHATWVRVASKLWEEGKPISEIAGLWMADSNILRITFNFKEGEKKVYIRDEIQHINRKLNAFLNDTEEHSSPVMELGESDGVLHRSGHDLVVKASGDLGSVEVVFNTQIINVKVAKLVGIGNRIIVLIVLLTGIGVFLIDKRLKRDVMSLITTTNAITSGNLDIQLNIRTGDALEELGEGFNRLARSLAVRQKGIDRAQEVLSATIDRKTAELRDERDRMSRILDNLPSAFILFDKELKITAVSSAVERLTGLLIDESKDQVCHCRHIENDTLGCLVRLAEKDAKAITGRQIQTRIEDVEVILEHSVFPVKENNDIVGWLETITDVTESEIQHRRLIDAERMSAVGEMASLLAHEIRNRLTSAKMLLQIDMEAENLTENQIEHLRHASESIMGMELMVEELLAFARPSPMEKDLVEIDKIIEFVRGQMKPIGNNSSVSIEFVNAVTDIAVKLDYKKTRQALVNLLLNATQFAGEGGTVRMTVSWSDDLDNEELQTNTRINIAGSKQNKAMNSGNLLCFVVDDTGSGISKNMRNKVFEPFYTTRTSGTGLGLAMVKKITEEYGGDVFIVDSPLGGARIIMTIPVERGL